MCFLMMMMVDSIQKGMKMGETNKRENTLMVTLTREKKRVMHQGMQFSDNKKEHPLLLLLLW